MMDTNLFPTLTLQYFLSQIKPFGKIVYEYNPFRNYRLSRDKDSKGKRPGEKGFDPSDPNLIEAGTIIDLDTTDLQFDLNSPLEITAQTSYDGSVNLIFNDNKNIPRLINSRFSVLQNNTYEIVDRIGNNDTNLYDEDQFDVDSSLYKRVTSIPKITFNGVTRSGNLPVGNYVVYIKYADADDNETDFVAESGVISCFVGEDCDPFSIEGGMRDQNSNKSISLSISNIDSSYDYVKVYYTRSTSDVDQLRQTMACRINKKFVVRNGSCSVLITGNEDKTDIPVSDINVQYFMVDKAKAQATCQNMLFLGNVNKPDLMYEDLQDISLRFLPYIKETDASQLIGDVDFQYSDQSMITTPYEYYNTKNIYYHVGYWSEEIYRLGIVYIMNDGSLSPVYNIRGKDVIPQLEDIFDQEAGYSTENYEILDADGNRQFISSDEATFQIRDTSNLENVKGVIRLKGSDSKSQEPIYSVGVFMPEKVISYLKGKVLGFFIVRQRRIPTILGQALILPMERNSGTPVIKSQGNYIAERFIPDSRILTQDYQQRLYKEEDSNTVKARYENISARAGICPDFEVNQPYFNQFYTGTTYVTKNCKYQPTTPDLVQSPYDSRHYYATLGQSTVSDNTTKTKIAAIGDNVPIVMIEGNKFRGRAGEAEEAFRFEYIGSDNNKSDASNLLRGIYYPYLAMVGDVEIGRMVNIYVPEYSPYKMSEYFQIRYDDHSPYYAIGDRISLQDVRTEFKSNTYDGRYGFYQDYFRGDCYICNFTHRLNRNFQDPETPCNDKIIDENTWKDNYDVDEKENMSKINRGDINAIQIGSWITCKFRSSYNLSIRSLDPSNPTEEGLTGMKRGFYPLQEMSVQGNTKIPNSYLLNTGFSNGVGEKIAFTLPDVPYIKNRFDNRIIYSDIAVNDAFKNGFRVFQMMHHKDYPRTYGGIMKLVEQQGSLICVFEHGVAVIPVNERAVAGEGAGGNVFINTSNVLPDNPKMLSDMYGSQWPESVVKTPYYIYGVDTVARKIWRTNGQVLEVISDFKIQQFLNQNISLSERELTPVIGIRNVKSHYNAYKQDVMFTFYDNLQGFEEKAWNICYNELMQKWITFYSWIPSYSANIDNIYFSFDRNTSKWVSKLGTTSKKSTSADGITLDNVCIDKWHSEELTIEGETKNYKFAILDIVNRPLPNVDKTGVTAINTYKLQRDSFKKYNYFRIENDVETYMYDNDGNIIMVPETDEKGEVKKDEQENIIKTEGRQKCSILILDNQELLSRDWEQPVIYLNIECVISVSHPANNSAPQDIQEYIAGWKDFITYNLGAYQSTIALSTSKIVNNTAKEYPNLTTDFWKHGQAGIIDIKDEIKPCFWYGKQHPFEFEVVVVDNPQFHKIFNNLKIISNKAKPDSFHYEVVGESYSFADDKPNMFIRQEATKDFYQYNGSDIVYNRDFLKLAPKQLAKSTMFPLYYSRKDTLNEIEDTYLPDYNNIEEQYKHITSLNKDYVNLSGSEIVYDRLLGEFKIWTHAKAKCISENGRIRGNMNYQEDFWDIQINPIIFVEKNEFNADGSSTWVDGNVPISVGNSPIPNDLKGFDINPNDKASNYMPQDLIDKGYDWKNIDTSDWTTYQYKDNNGNIHTDVNASARKETKIRDKYLKVRIRYTGDELAVITALKTLYTISYA